MPLLRLVTLCLVITLIFVGCSFGGTPTTSAATGHGAALPTGISTSAVTGFDPSVGAPLPDNRIVAAYGIVGGTDFNGPASDLDQLTAFLPTLQSIGQQFATLDPTHPVKLGLDLVINVIQLCPFGDYCSSWADSPPPGLRGLLPAA